MQRKLPLLTPENRAFWQGGEHGQLLIARCHGCGKYFHPPAPVCPRCTSTDVSPEPVSGRGAVFSFTINRQAWLPELSEPYVVAIVELDEQPGLRFVTNVVGMPPDEVEIGLRVRVVFLNCEDVWLPQFERDV
ncbi:MAG: hypothetical protein JWP15_1670 [Alphaproteobacteria bacterium]|nr:hypothetical protein [Alphaproteobacteria bacterium]